MSLTGFKARNHPQQATRDDVDDRRTPREMFAGLHHRHAFTVDAASSVENALLPIFWTIESSGLAHSWRGHRVWCNPPYSSIRPWVEKAWRETRYNGCSLVVMLLPANRCEQPWWQDHIEPHRDSGIPQDEVRLSTRFLAKRLRFDGPDGPIRSAKNSGPPFGCVLVTWERAA